jgi:tRNA 2-thiouridine synthesizing protein E
VARPHVHPSEKTYVVDARGFLADPRTWDEDYARCKAEELGMWRGLTEQHWKIIRFLRDQFERNGTVPTIYETCEANNVELEDLEHLFPTGYHRGAVKLAGLRVR